MPRPTRNDIYESVIRRMVAQALEEQERQFAEDHGADSEEQLIGYVRRQAELLCYTPRFKEIIGWKLITRRFGSWELALKRAGLTPVPNCPVSQLPRIEAEVEKQKELYRQRKAEKKLRAQQRMKAQNAKKKQNGKL